LLLDLELKQINAHSNQLKKSRSNWNLSAMLTGASVGRQTTTALILKAVIISYPQASSKSPRTTHLANTRRNTLTNPAIVTCFNCGKDSYFTTSCPELKDTGNIKEIEKEESSNKLEKKEP